MGNSLDLDWGYCAVKSVNIPKYQLFEDGYVQKIDNHYVKYISQKESKEQTTLPPFFFFLPKQASPMIFSY